MTLSDDDLPPVVLCAGCSSPLEPGAERCPLMDTDECSGPEVYGVRYTPRGES